MATHSEERLPHAVGGFRHRRLALAVAGRATAHRKPAAGARAEAIDFCLSHAAFMKDDDGVQVCWHCFNGQDDSPRAGRGASPHVCRRCPRIPR